VIDESSDKMAQVIEKYHIKSQMLIVIQKRNGSDWLLVVQDCKEKRTRSQQQKRLLRDISHRLRSSIGQMLLQKDLQKSVRAAEVASQAKGEFLATMSHELRTPLHGVIGLLGLMTDERHKLSDEQQGNLSLAQSSAHILSSLIDDILDLSKIEAGRLEIQHRVFDVEETLRFALVPFVMKAREKGLQLNLEMHWVAESMSGDELRMRQVLLNLVGNALKFTEKGFVSIETWQEHEQWHITIEDSGIGIAPEKQANVFSPFVQVHEHAVLGDNLQQKGTGLGTTIAKHFVEMMGGTLKLQSKLGEGSCFHICLPLHASSEQRKSLSLTLDDLVEQRDIRLETITNHRPEITRSVLLAEDDPIGRKIAIKQLKRAGFAVIAVGDGLQAWEKVREQAFDLLLTDIHMPGMDGMMLAKKVREYESETDRKRMLIVGLSAHALEEIKNEALAHGMDEFISKPVDMHALMDKLESTCAEEVV